MSKRGTSLLVGPMESNTQRQIASFAQQLGLPVISPFGNTLDTLMSALRNGNAEGVGATILAENINGQILTSNELQSIRTIIEQENRKKIFLCLVIHPSSRDEENIAQWITDSADHVIAYSEPMQMSARPVRKMLERIRPHLI